jgi:hypothetical protein
MLVGPEFQYDSRGRRSVEYRMERLHGRVQVVKAMSAIRTSVDGMIGHIFSPDDFDIMFGNVIYQTWGGKDNMLTGTARLIKCEFNNASAYLIFKPLNS